MSDISDSAVDLKPRTNRFGVGTIGGSTFVLDKIVHNRGDAPQTSLPTNTTVLQKGGWGVIFPHWMLLIGATTMFLLVLNGCRFTLRGILIWMTIMLIILSIGVRTCTDFATELRESRQDGA
jgi:hypothetical protein